MATAGAQCTQLVFPPLVLSELLLRLSPEDGDDSGNCCWRMVALCLAIKRSGKRSTHYYYGDCGLNRNTADNLSAWGRTGEGKRYNVSKVQLCSSEGADLGTPDP